MLALDPIILSDPHNRLIWAGYRIPGCPSVFEVGWYPQSLEGLGTALQHIKIAEIELQLECEEAADEPTY